MRLTTRDYGMCVEDMWSMWDGNADLGGISRPVFVMQGVEKGESVCGGACDRCEGLCKRCRERVRLGVCVWGEYFSHSQHATTTQKMIQNFRKLSQGVLLLLLSHMYIACL